MRLRNSPVGHKVRKEGFLKVLSVATLQEDVHGASQTGTVVEQWQNFLLAEAGASAALTGLLFVGVSMNLKRILSFAKLPYRALEALMLLLTVLVVSLLLLMPNQSSLLAGIEVLITGSGIWAGVTVLDVMILRSTKVRYRRQYCVLIIFNQLSTLPYFVAGVAILSVGWGGLYWFVPSAILSVIKALLDAWVLLVEINR